VEDEESLVKEEVNGGRLMEYGRNCRRMLFTSIERGGAMPGSLPRLR